MLTYEICRYIFFGGAILAGIMLIVSILLFFLYKIPNVIGDLSGANARKAIEDIRNQNANSGNKVHKSSQVNRERGKITDKISPSGNLVRNHTNSLAAGAMATEKIGTQKLTPASDETAVLEASDETAVLNNVDSGETTLLSQPAEENIFEIEYDITYIHTNEEIF